MQNFYLKWNWWISNEVSFAAGNPFMIKKASENAVLLL